MVFFIIISLKNIIEYYARTQVRTAAKVLANLASFRPNRDAMLRAGAVVGIVRGLASVHSSESLILEYLMKTLSQILESSQTNEPYVQLTSPEILKQLCNLLVSGVRVLKILAIDRCNTHSNTKNTGTSRCSTYRKSYHRVSSKGNSRKV